MGEKIKIAFRDVSKTFNGTEAVRGVSFEIMEGETLVLIGTSGCGKTTTMKMINRLVEPSEGEIEIDGRNIYDYDLIELRRNIGYVIQSIGLFPHLSIGRNVGIIPELMNWQKDKVRSRVDELMSMVGLDPDMYRDRFPAELSGGQQQRIGVARALAADPPVILMDEPFGALDPITREQLQNEFLALVDRISKTILFVTHDIFEAARIADRIAIMDKGRIVQLGSPKEIVEEPANEFVFDFLGSHHFQLSLLLKHIDEVMIEESGHDAGTLGNAERHEALTPEASFLDALNYFKRSRSDIVPVKNPQGRRIGFVKKKAVLEKMGFMGQDSRQN